MKNVLCSLLLLAAVSASAQAANDPPTIALLDVASSSYDASRTRLLTDVLRSELFKTGLFRIKERGLVQKALDDQKVAASAAEAQLLSIGKAIAVDKIVLTSLEKFGDTIALNLRIIDVSTALLDYTENVFIKNENLLFDALREVVTKVELRYSTGKKSLDQQSPEARRQWLAAQWTLLGAKEADLAWLIDQRESPEDYVGLRQYDIGFTPAAYVQARQSGTDLEGVRAFLQAGIAWPSVERALGLGIVRLDKYRQTFQPAGYSFDDYLTAFERKLTTPEAYRRYLETFDKDFLLLGLGGVANDFPIANAPFKFVLGQVAWEHYWTSSLVSSSRISTEAGVFLMNMIIPAPYLGLTASFGAAPFYGKVSIGEHAEVLVGGHLGTHIRLGFEVLDQYEFTLMAVPFGTQPKVSYVDLRSAQGDPGYVALKFPYAGVMFTYKFPVSR